GTVIGRRVVKIKSTDAVGGSLRDKNTQSLREPPTRVRCARESYSILYGIPTSFARYLSAVPSSSVAASSASTRNRSIPVRRAIQLRPYVPCPLSVMYNPRPLVPPVA